MIVSHRYRFIFIKTHKTAGSSMETALAPLCGPDDIVTPMDSNRHTDLPRNFHESHWLGRSYARSRILRKCIHRHSPMLGTYYYEHMPAVRVRELVGESIWNSYYKFCFERNPWDKVISYHNWRRYGKKKWMPSLERFVMQRSHRLPLDGALYFDGDECLMDDVFDYQDFLKTFEQVCHKLNIPYDGVMPREKTNITKKKPNYRELFTEATKEKVAQLYRREIALMGYSF